MPAGCADFEIIAAPMKVDETTEGRQIGRWYLEQSGGISTI